MEFAQSLSKDKSKGSAAAPTAFHAVASSTENNEDEPTKETKCKNCGKTGHSKKQCWSKEGEPKAGNLKLTIRNKAKTQS